jgi:hypothetical protein
VKNIAAHPKITVSADETGIVSQAGAVLLTRTLRVTGLDAGLSVALGRRRPRRRCMTRGRSSPIWR